MNIEQNIYKDRILLDLIKELMSEAYRLKYLGSIPNGSVPCELQISEKTRIYLKEKSKYTNLNNLI